MLTRSPTFYIIRLNFSKTHSFPFNVSCACHIHSTSSSIIQNYSSFYFFPSSLIQSWQCKHLNPPLRLHKSISFLDPFSFFIINHDHLPFALLFGATSKIFWSIVSNRCFLFPRFSLILPFLIRFRIDPYSSVLHVKPFYLPFMCLNYPKT